MTYTIDELKDAISIEDVLLECGAIVQEGLWEQNEVPIYCPFHLNTNTPAASMNRLKGVFFCYACDAGGSVIDAAMLHLDTQSVGEAASWLETEFMS